MGAIKKQFHVGDNVRIRMAPLNRPLPKLHSKWSKLYRIVAMKGVVVTVKDPETEETITVHVDRLAFSDPRLRDEIALEAFVPLVVPFRSVSNSLPNLLCERHLDQYTLPSSTSVHTHTSTPKPLDFLDQPSAQGKRGVRINLDPDYAYILVSRRDMAAEYSGARHAEIRRIKNLRARFPPWGVHLNHYYGVNDLAIVVTQEAGPIFFHGRTGTSYYYQEEVEGYINAYGEAYLGFCEVETPSLIPASTRLPLPVDLAAYHLEALHRGWFLTAILHRQCKQVHVRSRRSFSLRRITIR